MKPIKQALRSRTALISAAQAEVKRMTETAGVDWVELVTKSALYTKLWAVWAAELVRRNRGMYADMRITHKPYATTREVRDTLIQPFVNRRMLVAVPVDGGVVDIDACSFDGPGDKCIGAYEFALGPWAALTADEQLQALLRETQQG